MKIGKWFNFSKDIAEKFNTHGAVLSPTAMISFEAFLCFPVHVSPNVQIKTGCKVDKFSFINWNSVLFPNVYIGQYSSIGRDVQIGLAQHPTDWLSTHSMQYSKGWFPRLTGYFSENNDLKHTHHPKTNISADVWIGNNALIMSGLKIGHGAIVAAGAVVTKDVPPYAIVAGVPAKIIKFRFSQELIERLIDSRWWELDHDFIKTLPFKDINRALEHIESFKEKKVIDRNKEM